MRPQDRFQHYQAGTGPVEAIDGKPLHNIRSNQTKPLKRRPIRLARFQCRVARAQITLALKRTVELFQTQ